MSTILGLEDYAHGMEAICGTRLHQKTAVSFEQFGAETVARNNLQQFATKKVGS